MKIGLFSKNYRCKKKYILVIILLLLSAISTLQFNYTSADSNTVDIESGISSSVNDILNGIDFSQLESVVDEIDDLGYFDVGLKDKVSQIISGKYLNNYPNIISAIFSLVLVDIKAVLPLILTIVAIGILCSIMSTFQSDKKMVSDMVYFVCFVVMSIIIISAFRNVLQSTKGIISSLSDQMQIVFPILITLLGTIGSFSSISIYNPLVAILSTAVNIVFDKVLFPIFITIMILTLLSNMSSNIKLNKLTGFLSSTFKWLVGIVFTLFASFLSIQGISAGKFDSVSIKATKFAMKSYIPIIGGYISDGMDFIVLGSILVKNTIGLVGVIIILLTVLSPILNIILLKLGMQLSSGIIEMTGNEKMSNYLSSCAKILVLPIVLILGITFMYIITITLIMCTANIF